MHSSIHPSIVAGAHQGRDGDLQLEDDFLIDDWHTFRLEVLGRVHEKLVDKENSPIAHALLLLDNLAAKHANEDAKADLQDGRQPIVLSAKDLQNTTYRMVVRTRRLDIPRRHVLVLIKAWRHQSPDHPFFMSEFPAFIQDKEPIPQREEELAA